MRSKKTVSFILILAILTGLVRTTLAGEPVNSRLDATYVKLTDGTKKFSVSLSASVDDKRVYIENGTVQVTAGDGTGKIALGTMVTNWKGKASLDVKPGISVPLDKEGYYTFELKFDGNQKFAPSAKSVHVKDLILELTFSDKDSAKSAKATVYSFNQKGVRTALQDIPVEFSIKRLFCLYKFGGEKTDSTGSCAADFPKNMKGDVNGKMTVVAKVLDNDTYGNVETYKEFTGAEPLVLEPRPRRGLGDTDAPLWMVYTLLVLLSGVWIHVIYVIGLVIRINIKGKRELRKTGGQAID